jgi:hypothetical protein
MELHHGGAGRDQRDSQGCDADAGGLSLETRPKTPISRLRSTRIDSASYVPQAIA